MWEPFLEEARRAIVTAQEVAQDLGQSAIAPDHVLVGVAAEWRTAASSTLSELGATYEKLLDRLRIASPAEADKPQDSSMVFDRRTKRVVELAFQEARRRNHSYIGAEDLLLGIAGEAEGGSGSILSAFGITYGVLAEKLRDRMPEQARPRPGPFVAFDHVQLAMPKGEEDRAREFYGRVLGMEELQKPAHLAVRGGVWFSSGDVHLHLGVTDDFRPAAKAHAALRCREFMRYVAELREKGVDVQEAERLPDERERAFIADPFGNRIELTG